MMQDFLKELPPQMRERLMSMPPEERERMMARRRERLESMDEGSREPMIRHIAYVRQRPDPPDVGTVAPDFDFAVLDGDGARVRLQDQRGRPVALIFGSYT